jgi:precorrin-6A/cobalt-precorrin-6A reductase
MMVVDRQGRVAGADGIVRAERILILGGTGEGAALAQAATRWFGDALQITTSLAGRTEVPRPVAGRVRIGGFGGAAGLAAYLREEGIGALIDATHPFAARISAAARLACDQVEIPRLTLRRPPWRRQIMDRWIEVENTAAAAATVGRFGQRAWLTVGASEIPQFADVSAVHFVVRLVDHPRHPLPLRSYDLIIGRGPFSLAEERQHIERHGIDALVCKASGGSATEAKIIAARERALPVVIVQRPPPEPGQWVSTIEAALEWLTCHCGIVETKRSS